jgi:hypothetical protein
VVAELLRPVSNLAAQSSASLWESDWAISKSRRRGICRIHPTRERVFGMRGSIHAVFMQQANRLFDFGQRQCSIQLYNASLFVLHRTSMLQKRGGLSRGWVVIGVAVLWISLRQANPITRR